MKKFMNKPSLYGRCDGWKYRFEDENRKNWNTNVASTVHAPPQENPSLGSDQIMVRSYIGGLVKSYQRKVA